MRGFRQYLKSTGGNVALMFGLAAVPMIAAGGMAFDYMQASKAQNLLQQAVDNATLAAGASDLESEDALKPLVRKYLIENGVREEVAGAIRVRVVVRRNGKLRVTARGKKPTSFMGLVGSRNLKIKASTTVAKDFGNLELVLALDNTGSMNNAGKLDALKTAAKNLVAEMFDKKGSGTDLKIGIVPFSNYVNVGLANRNAPWIDVPADYTVDNGKQPIMKAVDGSAHNCGNRTSTSTNDGVTSTSTYYACDYDYVQVGEQPSVTPYTWNGCVGSRNYPLNVRDIRPGVKIKGLLNVWCSRPLLELTDVKSTIDSEIDAMTGANSTYIPAGLMWAWRLLSKAAPIRSATPYSHMSNKGMVKAIVLMTDGKNTMKPTYPEHESTGNDGTVANGLSAELCTNIKNSGNKPEQNIKIYTVAFAVTDTGVKDMLRNCATNPSYYFDAEDASALSAAFGNIAKSLTTLRISK